MMDMKSTVQPARLPRAIYVLLLLNSLDGRPLVGRTRLDKLTFLIHKKLIEEKNLGVTTERYEFRSLHFGPFTEDVFDDVEALRNLGLVSISGEGDETQTFSITTKGRDSIQRLIAAKRLPSPIVDEIEGLRGHYGTLSLDNLVRKVYQEYPEYTDKSIVRAKYLY